MASGVVSNENTWFGGEIFCNGEINCYRCHSYSHSGPTSANGDQDKLTESYYILPDFSGRKHEKHFQPDYDRIFVIHRSY
jgi:hypothetical protein